MDRDVVFLGELEDPLGKEATPFGDQPRCAVVRWTILQGSGRRTRSRFLVGSFIFRGHSLCHGLQDRFAYTSLEDLRYVDATVFALELLHDRR